MRGLLDRPMLPRPARLAVMCGCLAMLGACRTEPPAPAPPAADGQSAAPAPAAAQTRRRVTPERSFGDYLPPLDDGRIELAPPQDWKALPRSSDYLVRFSQIKGGQLPRIVVTASDLPPANGESPADGEQPPSDAEQPPADEAADVSPPEDAAPPAAEASEDAVQRLLAAVRGEDRKWTHSPEIVLLDQTPIVIYATQASAEGVVVEIIGGEMLRGTRRYRFELQSYAEFLDQARGALFTAMAAARDPSP